MIYEFFSGSYAEKNEDGIVRVRMDTDAQTMEKVYAYRGIYHPSYLAFNPSKTILYSVEERVPVGKVHALKLTDEGLLDLVCLSTEGADPCHVSLGNGGKLLFADNYTGGSLAVFKMNEEELPEKLIQLIAHEGSGVHPERQEAPHIHYSKAESDRVYTVDLGLDQVFVYEIDENGELRDTGARMQLPLGAGPRHIEFHRQDPSIAYVICELSNHIAVFEKENKAYVMKQYISTLPRDFGGQSTAAAIKMQDGYLFATNRGHDSIAVYKVEEDGSLMLTDIAPAGGKTPRDFTLFGDHIVIADQDSDLITVLRMDWKKGELGDTKMSFETVKPSCIRKI